MGFEKVLTQCCPKNEWVKIAPQEPLPALAPSTIPPDPQSGNAR